MRRSAGDGKNQQMAYNVEVVWMGKYTSRVWSPGRTETTIRFIKKDSTKGRRGPVELATVAKVEGSGGRCGPSSSS